MIGEWENSIWRENLKKKLFYRLKTSDSDFSDTEGGKTAKLHVIQGRVRQAALALLLSIIKVFMSFFTIKHTTKQLSFTAP